MSHGDVPAIGIVVADGLPINCQGAERRAAGGLQRFEVVRFKFVRIGCRHLGQAGSAALQAYEDEAFENLQLDLR